MKLNCQTGIFCISVQFPLATVTCGADNSHPLLSPVHCRRDYFHQELWKQILGATSIILYCSLKPAPWEGQRGGLVGETFHHTTQCAVLPGDISLLWRTRELHPQPALKHDFMMLNLWTSPWAPSLCALVQNHTSPLKPGPTASTGWSKSICIYINKSYNIFILWASSTRII